VAEPGTISPPPSHQDAPCLSSDLAAGCACRGIRNQIWKHHKDNPLFDVAEMVPFAYDENMRRSQFCLCPLGWAAWSPCIMESLQQGCILVVISDKHQPARPRLHRLARHHRARSQEGRAAPGRNSVRHPHGKRSAQQPWLEMQVNSKWGRAAQKVSVC
jgi:hypothetical protein